MIELNYRPFSSLDELTDFYCGIEDMDEFIHSPLFWDSLKEQECEAYIVRDDSERVVGLFALNMDILDLDDYDKDDLKPMVSFVRTLRILRQRRSLRSLCRSLVSKWLILPIWR